MSTDLNLGKKNLTDFIIKTTDKDIIIMGWGEK